MYVCVTSLNPIAAMSIPGGGLGTARCDKKGEFRGVYGLKLQYDSMPATVRTQAKSTFTLTGCTWVVNKQGCFDVRQGFSENRDSKRFLSFWYAGYECALEAYAYQLILRLATGMQYRSHWHACTFAIFAHALRSEIDNV